MRHAALLRQASRRISQATTYFFELGVDGREVERAEIGAAAWEDENVETRGQALRCPAKRLAAEALDAVPSHGVARLARDHEAEACRIVVVAAGDDKKEMRRSDAPSVLERAVELRLLPDAAARAKGLPRRIGHFL